MKIFTMTVLSLTFFFINNPALAQTRNGITDGTTVKSFPKNIESYQPQALSAAVATDTLFTTGEIDSIFVSGDTLKYTFNVTNPLQDSAAVMKVKYGMWTGNSVEMKFTLNGDSIGSVLANSGYIIPGPQFFEWHVTQSILQGTNNVSMISTINFDETAVLGHIDILAIPDTISPQLSFSSNTLDFSTVFVAYMDSIQLVISNLGSDSLFISNISSDNAVFTSNTTSSALGDNGLDTVSVKFSPAGVGSFTGTLTFTSNDKNESLKTVHLMGSSLEPPIISVAPNFIDEVLVTGDSASHIITIENNGASDLNWEGFAVQPGIAAVVSASPKFTGKGESRISKEIDLLNTVKSPQSLIYRSQSSAELVLRETGGGKLSKGIEINTIPIDDRPLQFILDNLNLNFEDITDAVPVKFLFSDGITGTSISDGGNDMYDGGNELSTDLGGPVSYSDNVVVDNSAFGAGGSYFTRKYPGLFVLVADIDSISNFDINGNNGADGDGSAVGAILILEKSGVIYYGFVKRVFGTSDPSINHLIIVEDYPGLDHEFSTDTNNDFHSVFNLQANTRLYYLLYAGSGGSFIDNETTLKIMEAFLEAIDPLRWIRLTPESGIIAAGASSTVEVFLDGRLLVPDDYVAEIEILSNDPASPSVNTPVRFKVLPSPILPPVITSIADVPEDQGGWVTVSWSASPDDDFFSPNPVNSYSVWLRDDGKWLGSGSIDATQDAAYSFLVHTLEDSNSSGVNYSVIRISAHPENPFTASPSVPDSGYSVDNLKPSVPAGIAANVSAEGMVLSWNPVADEDIDFYAIYRSEERGFDPSLQDYLATTKESFYVDSDIFEGTTYFYRLTSFDKNGNESGYTDEYTSGVVGIDGEQFGIPTEYVLSQNYPNPFNPVTNINYSLPIAGRVSLVIYDLSGKVVMRWDEESQAGYFQKNWNGTNNFGNKVSSGIYLYKLISGDFVQTRKMLLLK